MKILQNMPDVLCSKPRQGNSGILDTDVVVPHLQNEFHITLMLTYSMALR